MHHGQQFQSWLVDIKSELWPRVWSVRSSFVSEKSKGEDNRQMSELKGTDCDCNFFGVKSARGPLFERDLDAMPWRTVD